MRLSTTRGGQSNKEEKCITKNSKNKEERQRSEKRKPSRKRFSLSTKRSIHIDLKETLESSYMKEEPYRITYFNNDGNKKIWKIPKFQRIQIQKTIVEEEIDCTDRNRYLSEKGENYKKVSSKAKMHKHNGTIITSETKRCSKRSKPTRWNIENILYDENFVFDASRFWFEIRRLTSGQTAVCSNHSVKPPTYKSKKVNRI